jgi:lysophospholipase L1-like esterase
VPVGLKIWLAILGAAGALGAATFVVVSDVILPGADGASSGPSSGGEGLVVRALGDSVTAGFGYHPDGSQISSGEILGCARRPSNAECQDPDGVAYPARFAAGLDDPDFENLAVSGSTPADWLGEGENDLSKELQEVVDADPDLTVLTIGANPLLNRFLAGRDRICASTISERDARNCVRDALTEERTLVRLTRIYGSLLATDEDGSNGAVVVFQYPETHPPSAIGVRTKVLIEELRLTIDRAARIVREADPARRRRLFIAEPGPFLDHGCLARLPWILRVDSCLHPNVAGHEQMAAVLAGVVRERLRRSTTMERFATPGTSCGVRALPDASTAYPFGTAESRLGVTRGRMPCGRIEGLFERYFSDGYPCDSSGAGTCWQEYGKWRCVAPTYSLFPTNFTCSVKGEDKPISQIVGLHAKETTPMLGKLFCGSTNLGGGPFEIQSNFDCRAARRIAIGALTSNYGFSCNSRQMGIESSKTECRLDDVRVEWENGA